MNKEELLVVYDEYRTIRLNVKYYSIRLEEKIKLNLFLEIIIAVSAPGSVISGIWFLKTTHGLIFWQVIGAIAGLVGLVKPFLQIPKQIQSYQKALSAYRAIDFDLSELVRIIKRDADMKESSKKKFDEIRKAIRVLVTNPPEDVQKRKLVTILYDEVNTEIPMSSLYLPD